MVIKTLKRNPHKSVNFRETCNLYLKSVNYRKTWNLFCSVAVLKKLLTKYSALYLNQAIFFLREPYNRFNILIKKYQLLNFTYSREGNMEISVIRNKWIIIESSYFLREPCNRLNSDKDELKILRGILLCRRW